jgi:hypothetical protein
MAVAARVAAAVAGGYAVAVLTAIATATALPLSREEAATLSVFTGLLALPVAAMGCFWARSAVRAWVGTGIAAALFAGVALAAGWRP